MSEAELLTFTLKYLKARKIFHWRMPLGAVIRTIGKRVIHCPSPIKGMPDIGGILPSGQFFALELKSAKGKLSPEQTTWINDINKNNGIAVVIRTTKELIDFCNACDKLKL